jgi:hypothetical protein
MHYLGGEVGVKFPCQRLKGGTITAVWIRALKFHSWIYDIDLPRQRVSTAVPGYVLERVEMVRNLRYGLLIPD